MTKLLVLLVLSVTTICGLVTRRTMMDWIYGSGTAKTECETSGGTWDQKQLYCHR